MTVIPDVTYAFRTMSKSLVDGLEDREIRGHSE